MLKTVRDACALQPNALEIKISDQIEQLDELINSHGDGEEFFIKTHITQGMDALIREGFARLAGKSNQAVFHLKQSMGGGKTHLLVGFGLLARNTNLRSKVCASFPHIEAFDTAKVAAFNGRNNPNHFVWGEIASQLGKGEMFRDFWAGGPKAPDEKDWLGLFDGGQPILILLDEMPPYFHYLDTQKVGNGTMADIATRAFANMLTAAGKKANVCVVVSDLAAAYESGTNLINRALNDARQELGRQERTITPVDLAGNEIYEILRKRLFARMPDQAVIDSVAEHFGRELAEATKAKVASRGAEAIADEVAETYPFHPRLKNLVALFKENEKFKQTRGLMEIISRLLKSVWERRTNDVFLIGPQHFDLSISDVREKLTEISEMRDVIAKDLWDANHSAHTQIIDLSRSSDAAAQVGALLLTASLSTAVNAVKGLTREEIVESLVMPNRKPSEFLEAFEELANEAWYLHHTTEERYYFDRQENLTKLLQSLAADAPENKVDELIRHRISEMFKPIRKSGYEEVLALPALDQITDRVRRSRVLLVVSPDSKLPPEAVRRFFEGLTQRNNLCVLTGDKTQMASVEKAARHVFAAEKADTRIPKGHAQRDELERKQVQYGQDFNATVLSVFDKVLFPIHRQGKIPELASKPLDMSRDTSRPFNGEDQVEKTLTSDPKKLFLDVERDFDSLREKAEVLLWAPNQTDARWSDVVERVSEQAGFPWMPPKGIENLKSLACNRGRWEDLGNGYVTKSPKKKRTSVQVTADTEPDDHGKVRLRVNPINAGPSPKIYYSEDSNVSTKSKVLEDTTLETNAIRVFFLVIDPSEQFETGEVTKWENKLVIRNELIEERGKRTIKLSVVPSGAIRYSLDGSEPRNGVEYTAPVQIGDSETRLLVFAEAEGLETRADFAFQAKGKKGVHIDDTKPAKVTTNKGQKRLDSRQKTFAGLQSAREKAVTFEGVMLTIGDSVQNITITVSPDVQVDAQYIEALLNSALSNTSLPADTPVVMTFKKASFKSGHDLRQFSEELGIELHNGEVQQ
jgi:hypothetical protein